ELEVQHRQTTARRNFDKVNFGQYFSPYPLTESEVEEPAAAHRDHKPPSSCASPTSSSGMPTQPPPKPIGRPPKISGVQRTTLRSRRHTSDLDAGGLMRSHLTGEQSVLWVCDRCFKYKTEGPVWEIHVVSGISDSGNAIGDILLAAKCINVGYIQYGKSTAQSKGCTAKICLCSVNSSSMSRRCFSTVITVRSHFTGNATTYLVFSKV
ncbi:hypothetical protein EDD16DRAFT_1557204, partial [Pisolithus croceorrhizus]